MKRFFLHLLHWEEERLLERLRGDLTPDQKRGLVTLLAKLIVGVGKNWSFRQVNGDFDESPSHWNPQNRSDDRFEIYRSYKQSDHGFESLSSFYLALLSLGAKVHEDELTPDELKKLRAWFS